MAIHPTAVVDAGAKIDSSVTIGPYVVIEKQVSIGAGTEIGPHSLISGPCIIGCDNKIGPFTNIGAPPQDLSYKNEDTSLLIGNGNYIREYASIHRGTTSGRGVTEVGNDNMLMAYTHIAHDCQVGNHVVMVNAATLGGHVVVGDRATLGGLVAVHQFNRVGEHAYIGGMSGISKDVPPYLIVSGIRNRIKISGINKIGLKRNGFTSEAIKKISSAFMIIFKTPDLLLQEALVETEKEFADCQEVMNMVNFFRATKRSVLRFSDDE